MVKPIISKREYIDYMKRILNKLENYDLVLKVMGEALERFDPVEMKSELIEAKHVEGPISVIINASKFMKDYYGRKTAYCGGKDLKSRIWKLATIDHNLFCYTEIHRQMGDAYFNKGNFKKALQSYLAVLRFRPRFTYLISDKKRITPPELKGFIWPLVHDKKNNTFSNIRITKTFNIDANILAFLYSRLGRCFLETGGKRDMAEEAFNIASWFVYMLGPMAAEQLIKTVHSERNELYKQQKKQTKK